MAICPDSKLVLKMEKPELANKLVVFQKEMGEKICSLREDGFKITKLEVFNEIETKVERGSVRIKFNPVGIQFSKSVREIDDDHELFENHFVLGAAFPERKQREVGNLPNAVIDAMLKNWVGELESSTD